MDQRPGELDKNATGMTARNDDSSNDVLEIDAQTSELPDDPEQIKEQIEQTRNHMSETIDAIQEKLSFSNISDQVKEISDHVKEGVSEHISNAVETAKEAVYEATIGKAENFMQTVTKGLGNVSESMGEAGTYVVSSARRNPLPLALIGLGIGMLLMQNNRSTSVYSNVSGGRRKGNGGRGGNSGNSTLRQVASTTTGALSNAQKTVGQVAGSAYEGVGNVAGSAYEGVTNVAGSAYEGVTGAANSAYQGVTGLASSTGEQVQHLTRRAQTQYEQTLEENPLAIGAIALALGAVVGLAIPSTQYENQLLGDTRENLVQSVEEAARGAFERVQEVAGEVTNTVREQAQGQGKG
jgi:phage-related protein